MADRRRRDVNWYVADEDGRAYSVEHCQLAVLMDIREELQALVSILRCVDFQRIPRTLVEIRRNTTKRRKVLRRRKAKR